MPKMQIPEKLLPLYEKKRRYKIAIGGRGSAKSTTFADVFAFKAQVERAKVGCFREYQNSIEDSVHALLKEEIARLQIPGYAVEKTRINHSDGGAFRFRGLARSIDSVKSMHGFKYFWTEEAQFLSAESIKILTPTVREAGSEIWFSGNPMSSSDPFSQRFIVPFQTQLQRDGYYEDDMHVIAFVNYYDNPWFPAALEQEREHDYRTLDRALYDHIWLGAFNDFVENALIRAEWFDACVDAHKALGFEPRGAKIVAHDPSDMGKDAKGIVCRHGSVVLDAQTRAFGDVNEGCDWALEYAIENRADAFVWDCDGMGVSLRRQVADTLSGKKIDPVMFRGSNSVERPDEVYQSPGVLDSDDETRRTNKQTFRNLRAQRFWMLRDRVMRTWLAVTKKQYMDPDTLISFSSSIRDLQQLRSELCRVPRKHNPNGLIQIMRKDEMKRLFKIESPPLADSLMMSLSTPLPTRYESAPEPMWEAAF